MNMKLTGKGLGETFRDDGNVSCFTEDLDHIAVYFCQNSGNTLLLIL